MEKLINYRENLDMLSLPVFSEFQISLQIHTEFLVQKAQNLRQFGIKEWGLPLLKHYKNGKIWNNLA